MEPSLRPTVVFVLPSEGYRIRDYVDAARRLDVEMMVATEAHHGLAEDMGAHLIPIDLDRTDDSAKRIAASPRHIDAVIAIDDRGVAIAAGAAQLRDIAHNPVSSVDATRDKAAMRKALDGVVGQPRFATLSVDGDSDKLVSAFGMPAIVKPVGLAGSIGVIRIDDPQQAPETVARVRDIQVLHGFGRDHPVLVEEYVPGVEVSIEGLVTDGAWDTLAIFDKPDALVGPFFPETHYVTPSRLGAEILEGVTDAAARAAHHLGLRQGPVHAEFRIRDVTREIVLIELAARSIGGLCGRALRFGLSDTSLEELIIRNAVGERVRGTRLAPGASGVSMIPVPQAGTFRGFDGLDQARAVENITAIEVSAVVGCPVTALPEQSTYLGFVFARADTPDLVEEALRLAGGHLSVLVD